MTIAIDQANAGEIAADTAGSTIVLTTSQPVAANGFIVLTITCVNPQTVSSVSGGGLTWTVDKQGTGAGSSQVAIASAQAPAGLSSGTTITVNLSASTGGGRSCYATSFTGVATSSPVDTTNGPIATSATTAWATGSTTIAAGSLLIACSSDFTSLQTSTPTAPSIEAHDAGNGGFAQTTCYRIEAAGGAFTVAGTFAAAASGTVVAVAYKAAASTLAPFYLYTHAGTDRLWEIETWLLANHPTFVLHTKAGLARIANIEQTLVTSPLGGVTFSPYNKAGTDQIWAIEEYLLLVSGSNG